MSEEDKPPNQGRNNMSKTGFKEFLRQAFRGEVAIPGDQATTSRGKNARIQVAIKEALFKFQAEKAAENARKLTRGEEASRKGPMRTTDVTPPNSNGASPKGDEKENVDKRYPNVDEMGHGKSSALPPESPDSQSAKCTMDFGQEDSSMSNNQSALEVPSDRQAVVLLEVHKATDEQQQSVSTTTQCDERSLENENQVVPGALASRELRLSSSGKTFENGVQVVEEVSSSDSESDSNVGEVALVSSTVLSPTRADDDLIQERGGGEDNERSGSQNIAERIDSNHLSSENNKKVASSSVVAPMDTLDETIIGRKRTAEEDNVSETSKRYRVSTDNSVESEKEMSQTSTEKDLVNVVTASAANFAGSVTVQTTEHVEEVSTREQRGEPQSEPEFPSAEAAEAAGRPTIRYLANLKMDPDQDEPLRRGELYFDPPPEPRPVDPNYVPPVITLSDSEDDESELSSLPTIPTSTISLSLTLSSSSTSTVKPVAEPRPLLPTTTSATILSTCTNTVESVTSPIASLLTTTSTTLTASSRSTVEPVATETASFVANTQLIVDFNSRLPILPIPSLDSEECAQTATLSSDFGNTSAPSSSSNSSVALLPLPVSQAGEQNDTSATTSAEMSVTLPEITSEVTRTTLIEGSESTGDANSSASVEKSAASKSISDDPPETTTETPSTITEIKQQPDEEDETAFPRLVIRTDIFGNDDDDEEEEDSRERLQTYQRIINDAERDFRAAMSVVTDEPVPVSVLKRGQEITANHFQNHSGAYLTASNSSLGVQANSSNVLSPVVQVPGTFSGTSISATVLPANGSEMAPVSTTVHQSDISFESQSVPSINVTSTPISTTVSTINSSPVTLASSIAPVSSDLVPIVTTSSASGCSTVEVPTTSTQVHQRTTSSPAIANLPSSELDERSRDLDVVMDAVVKAAEENLAYVKQLAASVRQLSGKSTDVDKKMSALIDARQKSFVYHDTVDNVILSLRMKHKSLCVPEPRVEMADAKPSVEELAAYFEVLLESVMLSKKPHINDRMRGVLVVQITRLMRILGHYMHIPENFTRSEQTFTNVLGVLTTKPALAAKYSTSNLNYLLLNFWQCIRGVTRDTGYAKGAMMDHTNLGPKCFMDRVEKFKLSYERNILAKEALQAAQGPPQSQSQTQFNQPQQQVTNQSRSQSHQHATTQPSTMLQNQQRQQTTSVSAAVRHQQHQFIPSSQVAHQPPQQHQFTTPSQVVQQQSQQHQYTSQSQVVQQQPQQHQYTSQSQIIQQQAQQRQHTSQSQMVQQQQQQHRFTSQSQVAQQLQQQQYGTHLPPVRHPQQQQQLGSQQVLTQQQPQRQQSCQQLQQLLQNPQINYQSQIPHQNATVQYLRVAPTPQVHPQNVSQFQGQIRTPHPQQNQITQQRHQNNTAQQRQLYHPSTTQQFSASQQCSPNTASMLQRRAHLNNASQQQLNSGGQSLHQSQYLTQQASTPQAHNSPPVPRNILVRTRHPVPARPRYQLPTQGSEHRDFVYARQQLTTANGQYHQLQSQQQQRIQQQMPSQQIRQVHWSPPPQSQQQQQQMTTQQQSQLQPVASNSVPCGQQQQLPASASRVDDDIEILEVRPPSNPPISRSPKESTHGRILLHIAGGEQIGSVAYTGPIGIASPPLQATSLRRRSSVGQEIPLENMTLEGLLNGTPASNRVVVTPTNVVRPNSRPGLSPRSSPTNVLTLRTGQDAHMSGINYQNSVMGVGQSASLNNRHPSRNPAQQGQVNIQLNQQISSMPYNQQSQQLTLTYQQDSEPPMQAGNQSQSVGVPARATFSHTRLSGEMNSPSGTIHYGNSDHGSGQGSSTGNYSSTPGSELRISSVTSLANNAQNSSRRVSQSQAIMPDIAHALYQSNTVYYPDMEGNSVAVQQPMQMQAHNNNTMNYNGVGGGNNYGNT